MRLTLRSFLPVAILTAGAFVAPVQAQTMQNQQTNPAQAPTQSEAAPTDRIGVDASDPYSEQVYSGSQNPDMNSGMTNDRKTDSGMTNGRMTNNRLETSSQAQSDQQSARLQQLRYQVLDRGSD